MTEDPRKVHLKDQSSARARDLFAATAVTLGWAGLLDAPTGADDRLVAYIANRIATGNLVSCIHRSTTDSIDTEVTMLLLSGMVACCPDCIGEAIELSMEMGAERSDRCDVCDGIEPNNRFAEFMMRFDGNLLVQGCRGQSCECGRI